MTPPRLLIVDDEPDVEALLMQKFRRKLRKGEIELLFAHDGEHALEVLQANPDVDIVLSDINMPKMDGLALLDRLGALHEDTKTVMVSAYGDMANIRAAMNRGAFDFVTKPIEFEDLERTIEKTLTHLRLFRGLRDARDDAMHRRPRQRHPRRQKAQIRAIVIRQRPGRGERKPRPVGGGRGRDKGNS